MRLAAEFVGPVPVGDVAVTASVVRAARSAVLVEATVWAGDRACLHGRVWLVGTRDTAALTAPLPAPVEPPHGLPDQGAHFPYCDTIDWQAIRGSMVTTGPGLTWARPLQPLVADEVLSGLQRVALVGDSASGISSELDWDEWSYVNVDLDVHLSRPVDGEWVLIDAVTTLGTAGAALARSTVSDVRGEVGCTAQTLVVAPR
jgi:acyl-coenzyme A thioesterase PaaI-like protein